MIPAIFFILGLLTSRWLEQLLTRVVLKSKLPEQFKTVIRRNAKEQGIDTQEKGRIIKLSDADTADAIARPGNLFNDERPNRSDLL